jgi:ATP adenylyltransferase/5',5'''-P-1,P-4-tetraphosphate phosphorylase II
MKVNVLPLLPKAPLFIHNMHFKTKLSPKCYKELNLPYYKKNHRKYHTEVIGNIHVDYDLYASGIVNVYTKCSRNPYELETEEDRTRIIAFIEYMKKVFQYSKTFTSKKKSKLLQSFQVCDDHDLIAAVKAHHQEMTTTDNGWHTW